MNDDLAAGEQGNGVRHPAAGDTSGLAQSATSGTTGSTTGMSSATSMDQAERLATAHAAAPVTAPSSASDKPTFTHAANPVRVNALQITEIMGISLDPGGILVRCANGDRVCLTDVMIARCRPEVGDYIVTQADGYVYLNPRDVFERKYTAIAFDDTANAHERLGRKAL